MTLESPTDRRKRRTHTAVLDAAATLFAGHGYRATTIEMLARAADVAVSSIYANFTGGKADVYVALAWRTTTEHVRDMTDAVSVADVFDRYVVFHRDTPLALRLLALYDVDSAESPLVAVAKSRIDAALAGLVEDLAGRVASAGPDTDPRVLASTVWASVNGAVSLRQRRMVDEPTFEAMVALIRNDLLGHIEGDGDA
ncbi:TetR family transcriptional regulator [Rhodococcus sp. 06-1059B-a]|nr:TetR/AcrR family transcriptional regulator [Rhodococcus sp. 06-1059B-a]OZD58360.1 TetR family transcriptional regulator [Rhodococcus sp. 06-1059B-a]